MPANGMELAILQFQETNGVTTMSRVLVSQLARMGDLTQSLYLLRDLEQAEGHRVSVLVDKRLEAFTRARAPWLETIYTMDLERTLRGFRRGISWTGLWPALADELRPLRDACFERVINLNYGKLPAAVSEAIRGETPVEGFQVGDDGSFGDPWVEMVSRLVQSNRRWNRFHLVDVFRFLSPRRAPADRVRTRESKVLTNRSVVGVQIGTRCPKRTWGPRNLIEVIRGLQREVGCEILLFGEGRERAQADYIVRRAGAGRIRNLVGKTSLEDLVETLCGCDRLLSGDTGTLHLAAYLGVPSVGIFFGPAYVFETGPYGPGHLVLQAEPPCGPCREEAPCVEESCRALVPPDTVLRILTGESEEPHPQSQVYASGFVDNWMEYRPIQRRRATRDDTIGFLYRGSAGEFLGEPTDRLPSLPEVLNFFVNHYGVDRALLTEVYDALESSVPRTFRPADQDRLLGILHEGWTLLKETHNEYLGEESICLTTAAA
jgi:ADP-heptose:LPS heptosyltransferase